MKDQIFFLAIFCAITALVLFTACHQNPRPAGKTTYTPVTIGIDTAGSYHTYTMRTPIWQNQPFFDAAKDLGAQFVNLGDERQQTRLH